MAIGWYAVRLRSGVIDRAWFDGVEWWIDSEPYYDELQALFYCPLDSIGVDNGLSKTQNQEVR